MATARTRHEAGDLERRAGLRRDVEASPLCDASRFANDLEQLYRGMWAGWCAAAKRD